MAVPAIRKRVSVWPAWADSSRAHRWRMALGAAYLLLLTLAFARPLGDLMQYAARSDLHSHILLVPFVVGYLLYTRRRALPPCYATSLQATAAAGAVGAAALVSRTLWQDSLSPNDQMALAAAAFASLLVAGGFLFLGARWMAAAAFPVAFLVFMIPLPDAAVNGLTAASTLASAEAAAAYFHLAAIPLVRHGTVFELPGIVLQVGQQCSGIHSSWVLLITSVLASNLFLKKWWHRTALVALVIPLGILRNGFRVFVIGVLCVRMGPQMVDSAIHRRGGPLFFVLSLVPLFLVLWWLQRREQRALAG